MPFIIKKDGMDGNGFQATPIPPSIEIKVEKMV